MSKFPVEVKTYRVIRKSVTFDHIFCAHCGRELTKFNFKNGQLTQRQHYQVITKEGLQLRYCLRRGWCEVRREGKH
jgi:predicted transcriptional regulator